MLKLYPCFLSDDPSFVFRSGRVVSHVFPFRVSRSLSRCRFCRRWLEGGSVSLESLEWVEGRDPKGPLGVGKLMGGLGGNMLLVHGEGNTFADFEFWKHLGVQNNAIFFE